MAGRSTSVEVEVAGVIPSAARGELVKELIKFVLYQRNQIPMYFDQLRRSLACESQPSDNSAVQLLTQHKSSITQQHALVKTVEDLFHIVRDVFENVDLIKQILIILGPNIIVPKDAYLLHLPTEFYEGPSLTAKSFIQTVFRTFYNQDFLSGAMSLNSSTNLYLLFLAPRSCGHARFNLIPQLAYSVPSVGMLYEINLVCKPTSVTLCTSELGSPSGKELDISGVSPLDSSVIDSAADEADVLTANPSASSDYIWFQAPVTVKGYREKLPDITGLWDQ